MAPKRTRDDDEPSHRACPFCGEEILAVAKKCKHCGEMLDQTVRPGDGGPAKKPAPSATETLAGCVSLVVVVLLCGGVFRLGGCGGREGGASSKSLSAGDTAIIAIPNSNEVWVSVDMETRGRLDKLIAAKDTDGVAQLLAAGRVLMMPARTRVRILDPGIFTTEVRILNGPHAGRSGFISTDWVSRD
jgi:hypothetical protein